MSGIALGIGAAISIGAGIFSSVSAKKVLTKPTRLRRKTCRCKII
jgi:hypothetical protein